MSINTLMQGFNIGGAAAPAAAPVGSFAVAGELGRGGNFGYYPRSIRDNRAMGGANVAFAPSAWGRR